MDQLPTLKHCSVSNGHGCRAGGVADRADGCRCGDRGAVAACDGADGAVDGLQAFAGNGVRVGDDVHCGAGGSGRDGDGDRGLRDVV